MYIEIRGELIRKHTPVLVHIDSLRNSGEPLRMPDGGPVLYRSFFGYSKESADFIQSQGSTAGLKGLATQLDEIIIDVDDNAQVPSIREGLLRQGIKFEEWRSRRGLHFHIPTGLIQGPEVVYSVKAWLFSIFETDQFDSSMLHESGQIRTAWSQHDKLETVRKALVRSNPGIIAQVQLRTPPPVQDFTTEPLESDNAELYFDYVRQLDMYRGEGQRTPHLYIIVKAGIRAGMTAESIRIGCHLWNNQHCRPMHAPDYIDAKVQEIYRAGR